MSVEATDKIPKTSGKEIKPRKKRLRKQTQANPTRNPSRSTSAQKKQRHVSSTGKRSKNSPVRHPERRERQIRKKQRPEFDREKGRSEDEKRRIRDPSLRRPNRRRDREQACLNNGTSRSSLQYSCSSSTKTFLCGCLRTWIVVWRSCVTRRGSPSVNLEVKDTFNEAENRIDDAEESATDVVDDEPEAHSTVHIVASQSDGSQDTTTAAASSPRIIAINSPARV